MTTLDIKYGTELHKRVLDGILARVDMSNKDMQKHHATWEKADKAAEFKITEKSADALRRSAKENGNPQYVTIEVPYTYAQASTAHTYFSSVFLARNPVFQMSGRHGEAEMSVQAIEALLDYQTQVGRMLAPMYIWLHDAGKYGVGIVGTYWDVERHFVNELKEESVLLMGKPVEGKTKKVMRPRLVEGYEGNRLFNVRPADYIPDTRVPLNEVQSGEFAGRKVDIGWNTIVKRGLSKQYMNVEAVKKMLKSAGNGGHRAAIVTDKVLPGANDVGSTHHSQTSLVSMLPGIELVVELIPREWGLGNDREPQKWVFTVLDRKIIVEARPLGLWHNKFPFGILETEIEGHTLVKRGFYEIGKPMNDVMTWLFNSHFFAVRKSLNGDIVYDPSRVSQSDVVNSDGTGSRIRLKPEAYGQDVRSAINILNGGADITGSHLRDSDVVGQMLQRVLGVTDNLIGQVNPGGRKTATEVRTASGASINRLKTITEYMSVSAFQPLTEQLVQTTQQLYAAQKKFRIAGDTIWTMEPFVEVNPNDISGFYDFVPVDGTLPLDRFAIVNMWTNLLAQVRQLPQVAQEYNLGDIFAWVGQLAGIKNIKQFRIQAVPDGQLDPNGIPIGGQNGSVAGAIGSQSPGAALARGGGGAPVIPLARQTPGMGPSA